MIQRIRLIALLSILIFSIPLVTVQEAAAASDGASIISVSVDDIILNESPMDNGFPLLLPIGKLSADIKANDIKVTPSDPNATVSVATVTNKGDTFVVWEVLVTSADKTTTTAYRIILKESVPVFVPDGGGTYCGPVDLLIYTYSKDNRDGGWYTTDGSNPKTSRTRKAFKNNTHIQINHSLNLRAVLYDPDKGYFSQEVSDYYRILPIPKPEFDLNGGKYEYPQMVNIAANIPSLEDLGPCDPLGTVIFYTIDNSDPRTSSTRKLYKGLSAVNGTPINIDSSMTIKTAYVVPYWGIWGWERDFYKVWSWDNWSPVTTVHYNITNPIKIVPTEIPVAEVGNPYLIQLKGSRGSRPYSFFSNEDLPDGLSLSANGLIFGTPHHSGQYVLNINIVDAQGIASTQKYCLLVR